MPDRTRVEQDFCDLLAEAAPLEPENVQLVALFLIAAASGAGVYVISESVYCF